MEHKHLTASGTGIQKPVGIKFFFTGNTSVKHPAPRLRDQIGTDIFRELFYFHWLTPV